MGDSGWGVCFITIPHQLSFRQAWRTQVNIKHICSQTLKCNLSISISASPYDKIIMCCYELQQLIGKRKLQWFPHKSQSHWDLIYWTRTWEAITSDKGICERWRQADIVLHERSTLKASPDGHTLWGERNAWQKPSHGSSVFLLHEEGTCFDRNTDRMGDSLFGMFY